MAEEVKRVGGGKIEGMAEEGGEGRWRETEGGVKYFNGNEILFCLV